MKYVDRQESAVILADRLHAALQWRSSRCYRDNAILETDLTGKDW